jgi:hypothetical protein
MSNDENGRITGIFNSVNKTCNLRDNAYSMKNYL